MKLDGDFLSFFRRNQVFVDAFEQSLERVLLFDREAVCRFRADFNSALDNLLPGLVDFGADADALAATVFRAGDSFNPAIAFHAVENADQRGGLDSNPMSQVRLCELPLFHQPSDDLGLTKRDALRADCIVENAMISLCGLGEPEADALFEIIWFDGHRGEFRQEVDLLAG